MCAAWMIPSDAKRDQIMLDMTECDALTISQGDMRVLVGAQQLEDLADKLYFLGQVYKADVQDAVEFLCERRVADEVPSSPALPVSSM